VLMYGDVDKDKATGEFFTVVGSTDEPTTNKELNHLVAGRAASILGFGGMIARFSPSLEVQEGNGTARMVYTIPGAYDVDEHGLDETWRARQAFGLGARLPTDNEWKTFTVDGVEFEVREVGEERTVRMKGKEG
jgi:hypothetical protein